MKHSEIKRTDYIFKKYEKSIKEKKENCYNLKITDEWCKPILFLSCKDYLRKMVKQQNVNVACKVLSVPYDNVPYYYKFLCINWHTLADLVMAPISE